MEKKSLRLPWSFAAIGAGVAVVIRLIAAGAIADWSLVALVILGALFFSGAIIGLGWTETAPTKIGRVIKAVFLFVLIWGGMAWLGISVRRSVVPVPAPQGRADIRVKTLSITILGQDRLPTLDVHFENRGTLTADVQSYHGVYPSEEKDSIGLEARLFQRMLDETKNIKLPTYTVPAGSPRYMHYTGERSLTTQEEAQIRSGKVMMYFVGRLVYKDAVGWQAYEYCMYHGVEPRTFSCLTHNGPALP